MTIEIIWLYFVLIAAMLILISLPAFHRLDGTSRGTVRYATLDGLRGFLALSVFAFHLVVTREFIAEGTWTPPRTAFYRLLGPLSVSLFFMITGFLFWSKLLAVRGAARWRELYAGRLCRIAPMYLFAVAAMLLVVFIRTGFELREPPMSVVLSVAQWLALGIGNLQPDVNGEPASHVLAGVTWTIGYEWAFYASLPLVALAARSHSHPAWVAIALLACLTGKTLLDSQLCGFAALFGCGMLVASLLRRGVLPRFTDRTRSALALACLVSIFVAAALGQRIDGYGTVALIALALFFYLVASGASLFGLLNTRAARRLGNISYSIYLLQGIALVLVYWNAPVRQIALNSAAGYWMLGLFCAALLVLAASLTYLYVELPGMRYGRITAIRSPAATAAIPS